MADKNKKKKKWKKRIGKALLAGAALAGGLALAKRRKTNALNSIIDYDVSGGGPLSGKAGFEGDIPSASVVVPKKRVSTNFLAKPQINKLETSEVDISDHYAPKKLRGNLVPPSMRGGERVAEGYQDRDYYPSTWGNNWDYRAKGGRAGHKSGGRVGCGKAKRGFGRALKKK